MPKELEEKWNLIRGKQRQANPLLNLVQDLSHKFGMENDTLIAWLFDRESKIHLSNYELSDQELTDLKTL